MTPATGRGNSLGGDVDSERNRGSMTSRATGRPIASWSALWTEDPVDATLFFALIAALAWAPLWLGGNRPLAWGVNAVVFPGLVLLYEISLLLRGRRHSIGLRHLAVPASLFAAVVAWIFIQMSSLTLPSFQHPIWAMAAGVLDRPLDGAISVNRDLTALALLRLLTAASALWLSIQLCHKAERAQFLIRAIGVIVAVYAAYGLISYALFSSAILWFDLSGRERVLSSTFVNRNSFATYAGLGLVATIGGLLRLYRRETPEHSGSLSHRASVFIEATGRRGWVLLATAFVTLVALLGTASRGGITATALGLFVLFVLTFARHRRRASERIEAIVFVTAAVAACFVFYGDLLVGRIASEGVVDVSRLSVYAITVQSILDSPFLGFGYGAFADIFPMYRDRSIGVIGTWDKAHDTYLEVFQGLGLVVGTMLIAGLAYLVYRCVIGSSQRRQHATPTIVAVAAAALIAVHALVDFSLQIQGVTLTFMALLGAGFAQSISSRQIASD